MLFIQNSSIRTDSQTAEKNQAGSDFVYQLSNPPPGKQRQLRKNPFLISTFLYVSRLIVIKRKMHSMSPVFLPHMHILRGFPEIPLMFREASPALSWLRMDFQSWDFLTIRPQEPAYERCQGNEFQAQKIRTTSSTSGPPPNFFLFSSTLSQRCHHAEVRGNMLKVNGYQFTILSLLIELSKWVRQFHCWFLDNLSINSLYEIKT